MPRQSIKLKWLFMASLLNNAGAAMLWPLTTIYVHEYLNKSMTVAGLVIFFSSMGMMFGNYLGGWLFDNWKPYAAAVITVTVATLGNILMIFFHGWPMFPILLAVICFADGSGLTVINSYGSAVTGHTARYVYNMLYMALNVGVVVGTRLVGTLLDLGIEIVFIVASVCYGAYLLITVLHFNVDVRPKATVKNQQAAAAKSPRHNVHIVYAYCLCLVTVYLSYALWESVMSVHITDMHIPFFAYSLLWTINGAVIVLGQPLVTRLADYLSVKRQIIIGIAIFAISFPLLIWVHSFAMFVVDFVILTIGEMVGIPSVPAYIDVLTVAEETGKYQGMPNVAMSIGRALGPVYGGWVVDQAGYNFLFVSVFVMMLVTWLYAIMVSRRSVKVIK